MSEDTKTGKNGGRIVLIVLGVIALGIGYCTFSTNRDSAAMDTFIGHIEAGDYEAASAYWSPDIADGFLAAVTPPIAADIASHAPYETQWTGSGVNGAESYSTYTATGTIPDDAGCVLEMTVDFVNGEIVALGSEDSCPE
ncbi:hypothetical protein [Gymnodinialimonas hymeniacidonis]|uniref:hypothetical protein n=1 Tax=Gymnodinialimonas hymeniacidonis TaxID=3126508 RepID=UPI0034C66346